MVFDPPTHVSTGRAAESGLVGLTEHRLILLRHGETEWSKTGKHTSRTELDLTPHGRGQAQAAADTLSQMALQDPYVVCSPRVRAQTTAELAGLSALMSRALPAKAAKVSAAQPSSLPDRVSLG